MAVGDALNQPVKAKPAQVVAHFSLCDLVLLQPEHLRKQWTQLSIAEAVDLQAHEQQNAEQCLNAPVAETQGGGSLSLISDDGLLETVECFGSDGAVVADCFHFQHPSVGGESYAAQFRQVFDEAPHAEVVGVVYRGFGSQGRPPLPRLVVLLEVRVLVVDVQ